MMYLIQGACFFLRSDQSCVTIGSPQNNIEIVVHILEDSIIRVLFIPLDGLALERTWAVCPGGKATDMPYSGRDRVSDLSGFTKPAFKWEIRTTEPGDMSFHKHLVVSTALLRLTMPLESPLPFFIKWEFWDGTDWQHLAQDRESGAWYMASAESKKLAHYMARKEGERYLGTGETSGSVNKAGRRFRLCCTDAMGYDARTTDPLYKFFPFFITTNPERKVSYGIFYDNMASGVLDFGQEMSNYHGPYRYYEAEDGDLDFYFILGPELIEVTKKFSWMTGETHFGPRWSLGYSGSTMAYTDAPDAQAQLQNFIDLCEKYDMPCSSFQLSSGYTSIGDKRYVFNWNKEKFPNPEEIFSSFKDKGLKVAANLKPAMLDDHPLYEEAERLGLFIKAQASCNVPLKTWFWGGNGSYLDFTNPDTIEWWKKNVKEQILSKGIDCTWNDNNEYEILETCATCYGFGKETRIGLLRPLHCLLMMRASFEAQVEEFGNTRPWLISRCGMPGMQRYVQTWSGDNLTCWETIKYNIQMGLGLSLSGVYNFGHDVGGFAGPAPSPELFVRWVQNGIFYPRFTIHSWNSDGTVNEPWMYEEVTDIIRSTIQLRYRLIPHIYNLLRKAHTYSEPIIRPTFLEFEGDAGCWEDSDDFMLGPDLLIASVITEGARSRRVYLPVWEAGWYDFHSGNFFQGGQEIVVDAPLERIPIFVRGNSVLFLGQQETHFETMEEDSNFREMAFYPAQGISHQNFEIYDDEKGSSNVDVLQLKGLVFAINLKTSAQHILISIKKLVPPRTENATEELFQLSYSKIKITLPNDENRSVLINGLSHTSESFIDHLKLPFDQQIHATASDFQTSI